MAPRPIDQTQLKQFLLGRLSEDAAVQVEDNAFADPEYLAALEDAEADLIDAYVRAHLSSTERVEFERRFLTSPRRISKVEFARAFAPLAADAPAPRPAAVSWLDWFRGGFGWPQLAAGSAALVLLAAASWLGVENGRMRTRMAALEVQSKELQARSAAAERQIAEANNRADRLVAQLQNQRPSPAAIAPVIASLVLLPGLTRAELSRTQLSIPPAAQLARIEVQLEAGDVLPRYRAELRTSAGREILARSGLSLRRTAAGPAVVFDVPSSDLAAGEYELELKGAGPDNVMQDLGYYYFRVTR